MATAIDGSLFIFLVATEISKVQYILISFKYDVLVSSISEIRVNDQECLAH